MAPSATSPSSSTSPLDQFLSQNQKLETQHDIHLHDLTSSIQYNLQYQNDWTALKVHTHSTITKAPLPRPLISGLPPRRVYVHPDEQIETLKAEHETGEKIEQFPEREWVVPTQLNEKWSLEKFAAVFDAIEAIPETEGEEVNESEVGAKWRGENRQKRALLATLHDDSTVVYYIMHNGLVKPRQN